MRLEDAERIHGCLLCTRSGSAELIEAPCTAQLADGSLIAVWSGNLFGTFFVRSARYRPEDL